MKNNKSSIVKWYYEIVDDKNFDRFENIFSKEVIYDRCGFIIEGIKNLKEFYVSVRRIEGIHSIDSILEIDEKKVIVFGTFNGERTPKVPLTLDFVDVFLVENNFITYRKTYLSTGLDSTI